MTPSPPELHGPRGRHRTIRRVPYPLGPGRMPPSSAPCSALGERRPVATRRGGQEVLLDEHGRADDQRIQGHTEAETAGHSPARDLKCFDASALSRTDVCCIRIRTVHRSAEVPTGFSDAVCRPGVDRWFCHARTESDRSWRCTEIAEALLEARSVLRTGRRTRSVLHGALSLAHDWQRVVPHERNECRPEHVRDRRVVGLGFGPCRLP